MQAPCWLPPPSRLTDPKPCPQDQELGQTCLRNGGDQCYCQGTREEASPLSTVRGGLHPGNVVVNPGPSYIGGFNLCWGRDEPGSCPLGHVGRGGNRENHGHEDRSLALNFIVSLGFHVTIRLVFAAKPLPSPCPSSGPAACLRAERSCPGREGMGDPAQPGAQHISCWP